MIPELHALEPFITDSAARYKLDPRLVSAIVMQESGGNLWAYRYEPKSTFSHLAPLHAKKLSISYETELFMQHCSWGLMQILGVKAREIGFDSHLPQLLLPSVGIEWGCKALYTFKKNFLDDTIASYNAGSPIKNLSGKYINQGYVDSVKQWMVKV